MCIRDSLRPKVRSADASIKYILETDDGHMFECVYMPHEEENGVVMCLSCQIGCVNKCTHCATGKVDFVRDLTAEEICDAVGLMLADNGNPDCLLAVLFMGMGEPFLNYENVLSAIDRMEARYGIEDEHVTISTVGIVPRIREFADLGRRIRLAVSAHATLDSERSQIIPLNLSLIHIWSSWASSPSAATASSFPGRSAAVPPSPPRMRSSAERSTSARLPWRTRRICSCLLYTSRCV